MFCGVSKIIIDEGKKSLITNIYDLINASLVSINKQPILEKQEYKIMEIFNQMKYGEKHLWVIPSKKINGEELIFNAFTPINNNGKVKIYENKEKCEEECIHYNFNKESAIQLEINSLFQVLKNACKGKLEIVNFSGNNYNLNVDSRKVLWILQRMLY